MMKRIYITLGDINGIGPEVALKALSRVFPVEKTKFSLIGDRQALNFYLDLLKVGLPIDERPEKMSPEFIDFIPVEIDGENTFQPGRITLSAGKRSAAFIREAVSRMNRKQRVAVVTAPISKEALWQAGILFPGQTEFISHLVGESKTAMMLVAGNFRIAFVTTHHPLKMVPGLLNSDLIVEKCHVVYKDLQKRFHIQKPRIAVASLNPHSGEHGNLGTEERDLIIPAIKKLQKTGMLVDGPFSSDTLFTRKNIENYDAFIALYHDQGMIPIKMYAFGNAVNYTAGLPVVRTSPDHGTAFNIAGRGIADASSMVEAVNLALKLVN